MIEPTHLWVPPRVGSLGDEAVDLAAEAGWILDEEQASAVDAHLSYGAGGKWVALETAMIEGRQNGKALDATTELLTENRGWVSMAEVRVGDRVFHPAGHSVAVTYVSAPEFGRECFRVTTTDGRSVVADADHLWTVTDKRRTTSQGPRGATVKRFVSRTLTTREMVDAGLSRYARGGRTSVTDGKRYATNEYRFALPVQEPVKSADADLPLDPYLFGAWLGDGTSASAALTCHVDDVDHWRAAISAAGFTPTVRPHHGRALTVGITSPGVGRMTKAFAAVLRRMGVLGDKHVPDLYLTAGTSQREALLQGMLDTDGTVDGKRGQVEFCSTSRRLANAALYLGRSLGWRATLVTHRATLDGVDCGPKYRVCFTPTKQDPFAPFRMERKARKVKGLDGGKGRRTVSVAHVEPVPSVPVRCIKVDSPDGLFLAGRDLVATHNTTGVLQPVTLFDLFLMPASRILWTAHLFKTSRDSFDDFKKAIDATPTLSRRVKKVRDGHGDEEIILHNGATLEFLARSSGGGRGLKGVSRVVFDEALILASAPLDSVIPTLSAMPNPQINYGSSAAKANSEHLHKLIKRGRSMADPSLIWVEFCAPGSWTNPGCEQGTDCPHRPGVAGCSLDNEELWPLANHSIGRTRANGSGVTYEYVRGERRTLSPQGFGRERLGWHEALSSSLGVLDEDLWRSRIDVRSVAAKPRVGVALDASPDLASAAIGMTGIRADGRHHWQVLDHQPGTGWTVGRLQEYRDSGVEFDAVGVDPAGPAGALIPALKAAGFEVVEVTGRALVQAWGAFSADVKEDRGRHLDQYAINQAIRDAAAPPSGDVAKFSRVKSSGDISPLVAVTISDHMLRTFVPDVVQQFFGAWR